MYKNKIIFTLLQMNRLLLISFCILILSIICYKRAQSEEFVYFFPHSNTPSVTPDYNPFHPAFPPERLDYIINVPKEYKTNASKSWMVDAVVQCNSYSNGRVPESAQDCPDSSFTFIDRPDYKGCIQLVPNTNYCMSDKFGNYIPNIDKLNVDT
jgi:hypothetical protein